MLKGKFLDYIRSRLSNVPLPDDEMLEMAFSKALEAHARLEPRIKVIDYTGNGQTYQWSLPSDFLETSVIRQVEYPVGAQKPILLEPKAFYVYRDLENGEVVKKFRLVKVVPSNGEKVRVTYTTVYTVTDEVSDLPADREAAVCDLGASVLASMMSSEYAKTQSSTLEADIVNNLAKIDHYINLSRHYLNQYKAAMGMKPDDIVPVAQGITDYDVTAFQKKFGYLVH